MLSASPRLWPTAANQNTATKTTQSRNKMDAATVPHPLSDLSVHHTLSAVRRQPLLCSPLPRLPVFTPRPSSSAAPQHSDSRLRRHVTEPGLTLSLQLTPFIQQSTSKHRAAENVKGVATRPPVRILPWRRGSFMESL